MNSILGLECGSPTFAPKKPKTCWVTASGLPDAAGRTLVLGQKCETEEELLAVINQLRRELDEIAANAEIRWRAE